MNKYSEHTVRVRYGETDKMGFVYYGNYALYLEEARTELIRHAGVSYKELEKKGIELPVINMTINYRKPALYDDVLTLVTCIEKGVGKKITFKTDIFNANKQKLISASVTLIFVNAIKKQVVTCPAFLLDKLESYLCN